MKGNCRPQVKNIKHKKRKKIKPAHILLVLANANDEYLASKPYRLQRHTHIHTHNTHTRSAQNQPPTTAESSSKTHINSRVHTTLHARAVQRKPRRAAQRLPHPHRLLLRRRIAVDEDGARTREQLLGKVEPALEEVGDDDRLGAGGPRGEQRDEADRACTAVM